MSWKASAWAKEQRVGSPFAKSILMCLGDGAHPETNDQFSSQEYLAEAAEVSPRTLREWLGRFERWGLIRRDRRTRRDGSRAADRIVVVLDCTITDGAERLEAEKRGEAVAVEGQDGDDLPANAAGRTNRQPATDLPATGDTPTGSPRPPFTENNQDITVEREARASADQEPDTGEAVPDDDPKAVEKAFWVFVKDWPSFAGMPKAAALKAWSKATPADRTEAMRKRDAWLALLRAQKKSHVPAPSTYLTERLFAEVPEPNDDAPSVLEAKPFGPVWQAARLRDLLAGPQVDRFRLTVFEEGMIADGRLDRESLLRDRRVKAGWPSVNRMHDLAEQRRSLAVEPSAEIERLAKTMVACHANGDAMAAWRALHDARGWPWLPDTGAQPVVYWPSPALDPEAALAAFEAQLEAHVEPAGRSASPPATGKTGSEAAE